MATVSFVLFLFTKFSHRANEIGGLGFVLKRLFFVFKMPKRKCVFNDELQKEYPFIKKHCGDSIVFCNKCMCSFSIAHGGKDDINQHLKTRKHKDADISASSSKTMTRFFKTQTVDEKLAATEGTWAYHCVYHNHSFRSADCTSKLVKKCFEEKYTCARTKTEAIVCNVLKYDCIDSLKRDLSGTRFLTIFSDCSNHGSIKICPILVRYFLPLEGVKVKVLDVHEVKGETSDILVKCILDTIQANEIRAKVLALCADNTNCNFGGAARNGRNNIFHKLKTDLGSNLIGANCAAHIAHNCISTAAECLPFDIEMIVDKIFRYFHIYTVRTNDLKEMCDFVECEYQKLLGYSNTRWLALLPAIERLIKMFQPVKSYFLSQERCPVIIKKFFEDESAEIWLYFLHNQSAIFQNATLKIESQRISMIEVAGVVSELRNKLETRKNEVFVPLVIRKKLKVLEEDGLPQDLFKQDVLSFYTTCIDYLDRWTTHLKEIGTNQWILLKKQPEWSDVQSSMEFIVSARPDSESLIHDTELFDEYSCLKSFVTEEKVKEWKETDVEEKWTEIFRHFKGKDIQYENLCKVIEFFLCLPGSNAPTERSFSIMNKVWSKEKTQLQVDTLKSLMIVKYNYEMSCPEFYDYLSGNVNILKKIHSVEKYTSK